MLRSQNGWGPANDPSVITYWRSSNGTLLSSRRGDVTTVMRWVAERFHADVEHLHHGWCWGYAPRLIRGSSSVSNHASGTAIDLNAPAHPLGTNPRANYSRKQIRRIRRIVRRSKGVIRWGGDYHGRKDGMHFEINAGHAATGRFAKKVRSASGMKEDDMLDERVSASIGTREVKLNPGTSTVGWFKEYADPDKTHGKGDPSLLDGPCNYQIGYIGTIENLPPGHKVDVVIVEAVKHGKGKNKTWDVGEPVGSTPTLTADDKGKVGFDVASLPGGHIPKRGRVWLRIHCHGAEGAKLTRAVGQGWYGR